MESINREAQATVLPLRAFFIVLGFYAVVAAALMTEGLRSHGPVGDSSYGVVATFEP